MAKKTQEAAEGTVSKMEAVRQTLAAGVEKPQEAVAHVKEKFGLDITSAVFSSYKSAIGARQGSTPGKPGRKPKESLTGVAVAANGNGVGNGVQLAQDVKALVERYGADAVKGMADVFAG